LDVDLDQRNVKIAQHRLAELKENLRSGGLSQTQYDEQLADLEQALSDDLDIQSNVSPVSTQSRWIIYVLVIATPLLAGTLYWSLGNYQAVSHSAEMAIDTDAIKMAEINKMVSGLAEKLKNHPDDAQGWLMLGRSYDVLEQHTQAIEAFAHAYKLLGDQPEILLLYADALGYVNERNLTGKPSELIFKALALEPDNMKALWLGGMAKAQQGDAATATTLWKKLEILLPPGSEYQQEIQSLLAKLEREMPSVNAHPEPTTNISSGSITVQVSLAPELIKSAAATDTVFVYAQALSGPKMPLAIVRKQVSDLPITVSLNDTMAMMPNMKLSNFSEVKLLARVSKSGNAMSQAGDLIGAVNKVVITDKNTHHIIINDSVK
jgi:cytochrome c-type biogenesis protein CcmH